MNVRLSRAIRRKYQRGCPLWHLLGATGQGVCLLERSEDRFIITLRQRSYSVLIFSSLSRLAVMDSRIELVPLIHAPPSPRRSSGKGP